MRKIALATMLIAALASPATAQDFCFTEAGAEYGIAPIILQTISKRESSHKTTAVNYNTDGTYDYCHMQINTLWYPDLGPERWAALSDPCYCTKTGAWILSKCINKYGYNWKAVGCYHSQTPAKRDRYAVEIATLLNKNNQTLAKKRAGEPQPPNTILTQQRDFRASAQ